MGGGKERRKEEGGREEKREEREGGRKTKDSISNFREEFDLRKSASEIGETKVYK